MESSQEKAEKILRAQGLDPGEALRAKRNIDARLDGYGLPPSVGAPAKIPSGFEARLEARTGGKPLTGGSQGAASALLLDPRGALSEPPLVVGPDDPTGLDFGEYLPSDLAAAVAVTSLATTVNGGTETKFNRPGIVRVGDGAIGVYRANALGANINTGWQPLGAFELIPYYPQAGLFVGTNTVGGIAIGGVLTLAFYALPRKFLGHQGMRKFLSSLGKILPIPGTTMGPGSIIASVGGGTDVTLGTFSDAGAGTQIFKAGTNFPTGGAGAVGSVIMNAPPTNTDVVWVAETSALAVASNGGISQSGQDIFVRALNTKLFMLANSGTQKLGCRYRS